MTQTKLALGSQMKVVLNDAKAYKWNPQPRTRFTVFVSRYMKSSSNSNSDIGHRLLHSRSSEQKALSSGTAEHLWDFRKDLSSSVIAQVAITGT